MYWVKAVIKRGSHTQNTKGYLCKFLGGDLNTYEAILPEKEQYVQPKALFEVDVRMEEKMATFNLKTASYEIQMSSKNESQGFIKIHTFDLNMAQYLNQISHSIDVMNLEQIYTHRPDTLFEYTDPKSKIKCKVWIDIELGDK